MAPTSISFDAISFSNGSKKSFHDFYRLVNLSNDLWFSQELMKINLARFQWNKRSGQFLESFYLFLSEN